MGATSGIRAVTIESWATAGADTAVGGRGSGDSGRIWHFSIVSDKISLSVDARAFGLPLLSNCGRCRESVSLPGFQHFSVRKIRFNVYQSYVQSCGHVELNALSNFRILFKLHSLFTAYFTDKLIRIITSEPSSRADTPSSITA